MKRRNAGTQIMGRVFVAIVFLGTVVSAQAQWTHITSPDLPDPTHAVGMCDTGTHIWVAINNPFKVAKINKVSRAVEGVYDLTTDGGYPYQVAFDGSHIWVLKYNFGASNPGSGLEKLDPDTGAIVGNYANGYLDELLFDGAYIWVSDNTNHTLHKIDIDSATAIDSLVLPSGPGSIVFDGDYIWAFEEGSDTALDLYKIAPNDVSIVASKSLTGLASDLWSKISYDGEYIYAGGYQVNRETLNTSPFPFGLPDGHMYWKTDNALKTLGFFSNPSLDYSTVDYPGIGLGRKSREGGLLFDGQSIWLSIYDGEGGIYVMPTPHQTDLVNIALTLDKESDTSYKLRLKVRSLIPLTNPNASITLSRAPGWQLQEGAVKQQSNNSMFSEFTWKLSPTGSASEEMFGIVFGSDQFSKRVIVPIDLNAIQTGATTWLLY